MSEKIIHAKSRFKFRSDTAANWAQNNPVLLAGEFGVVTDGTETDRVKIGDGMTAWNGLDWWRGPQGVKGDMGDKGNTGAKGYKGDSIINVRIDSGNLLVTTQNYSTGEIKTQNLGRVKGATGATGAKGDKGDKGDPGADAVTDEHFDPTSANAQSGKAVAEAVNPIMRYITYSITGNTVKITGCDTSISGDYEIPREIGGLPATNIYTLAFQNCIGLTSITIPESVTRISNGAFRGCSGLTEVKMPSSVTQIGTTAFYGCTNIADVYYSGTPEQWNAITIGSDNAALTHATIHFNQSPAVKQDIYDYHDTTKQVFRHTVRGKCFTGTVGQTNYKEFNYYFYFYAPWSTPITQTNLKDNTDINPDANKSRVNFTPVVLWRTDLSAGYLDVSIEWNSGGTYIVGGGTSYGKILTIGDIVTEV